MKKILNFGQTLYFKSIVKIHILKINIDVKAQISLVFDL
jgi:hypothetical protein